MVMKLRALCSLLSVSVLALASAQASAAGQMSAAVISDGKVKLASVPIPDPGQGQVRIKVRAASVNPVDWKVADRAAPGTKQIAGKDLAGVIDAVGVGVTQWKAGDAVIGIAAPGSGSYAEYALASAAAIAAKPTKMTFEEASGIPVVAETAWRAIITVGNVQKGQRVLIHGAAGGVGSSAVQFAKARGAFVIGTASARNHEFLKSIGADEVIDYTTTRFETKVHDIDVVVNTADADTSDRSIGIIRKGGILVSVVGPPSAPACAAAGIRCSGVGTVNGQMLPAIVDFANHSKFGINIDRKLTLADAAKAWELNRAGHTRGKIVLVVSSGPT
jgi:NADPH:quinone reductase-like Zn-dependent oxidoreductase